MSILTDAELSEIRAELTRRDPTAGQGYNGATIESLLDTIDALRAQLVSARLITPKSDPPS